MEADIRKSKGLGRWTFLDNGPGQIRQRVARPAASVIMEINVLSTSNTTSRSPATVGRAAPGAPGNLPGELGEAHVHITSTTLRDRVRRERAEEKPFCRQRAYRRAGNFLSEPAPETRPDPTATSCSCSKGAAKRRVSGRGSAKCRLSSKKSAYCRIYKTCPHSQIDFRSGCFGESKTVKQNFSLSASCMSLNRLVSAKINFQRNRKGRNRAVQFSY